MFYSIPKYLKKMLYAVTRVHLKAILVSNKTNFIYITRTSYFLNDNL